MRCSALTGGTLDEADAIPTPARHWERDAGVLTKLMVTPTPRSALTIAGLALRRDRLMGIGQARARV